jgi:BMFP domain-containing protein YqiC
VSVTELQELLIRLSSEQLALGEEITRAKNAKRLRLLAFLRRIEYHQEVATTAVHALLATREENVALRARVAELEAERPSTRPWWKNPFARG